MRKKKKKNGASTSSTSQLKRHGGLICCETNRCERPTRGHDNVLEAQGSYRIWTVVPLLLPAYLASCMFEPHLPL
ncbi:hypothetical protein OJAV_G00136640 [Oryzias javanicus]|uniref:Uncharacterized protein n=1 Tax=Oryzias javanicus TaxID=123683 RepID=A0A437CL36_ORYJA|nr:hypothetical protein OJAV_G00136640 [Oryzias javanicus]